MRKAFTLIELLVVIAIIAILAAILFPVFAQAKAAAKGAASISNTKQHVLAIIMYGSDNEDYLPLGTAWNTGNDPLQYAPGLAFSSWGWSVQPYMKSGGLFHDPLAAPNAAVAGVPRDVYDSYYSQYGYNYTYLSPFVPADDPANSDQRVQSVSQTTPGHPTQTVMIVSKWANAENTSGYDWGTGFPGGMLFAAGAETPYCATIPVYCATNWGVGGFFDDATLMDLGTNDAGQITGGNSRRSTNKHVVGWVDGHAGKMASSALAAGTNWTETIDTNDVDVTSCTAMHTMAGCGSDTYLWDIE